MTITYELLEEYTGTRTTEMPDMENEGEMISSESDCRDIQVKFTCSDTDCVHERSVNVCFDAEGEYDAEATLVRVGEVANGVAHKIAVGVITKAVAEEVAE
tara:strand:+ start:486 stop:788 length:303 start_codon:yes stop_codon:yes gene_type:complete